MSKRVANRRGPSKNKAHARFKLKQAIQKSLNEKQRKQLLEAEAEKRKATQIKRDSAPPPQKGFFNGMKKFFTGRNVKQ